VCELTLGLLLQRDLEVHLRQRVLEQERVEWRMQLEKERQERTKEREEDRAMIRELLDNQVFRDVLCSARVACSCNDALHVCACRVMFMFVYAEIHDGPDPSIPSRGSTSRCRCRQQRRRRRWHRKKT
jgi:hypothetical protein